jgi:hypothetical protein
MSHWLDKVKDILSAETISLRELATIAGYQAENFYVGTDMSGADLSGQDVRGIKFTNLEISKIKIDRDTKIDDQSLIIIFNEIRLSNFIKSLYEVKKRKLYADRLSGYMKLIYLHPDINPDLEIFMSDKSLVVSQNMPRYIMELNSSNYKDERFRYMAVLKFIDNLIKETFTLSRRNLLQHLYEHFSDEKEIGPILKSHYSRFL